MRNFIQISDPHIVEKGSLCCSRSDTAVALQSAVASINALLPQVQAVDCVIVTGDLTDHGSAAEYAHFAEIMSALKLPWLAIPGNHDQRAPLRATFAETCWAGTAGAIQWRHDIGDLTVIGLDTLLEGAHYGHLADEGLAFLDDVLREDSRRAVVVATHHPVMASGILAMDEDNLRNGAALMRRLETHEGPVRMISGHVHRSMTTRIGNVTCQIAPSVAHAVDLRQHPNAAHGLVLEPGGFVLHTVIEGQELLSTTIPVGRFAGPFAFE